MSTPGGTTKHLLHTLIKKDSEEINNLLKEQNEDKDSEDNQSPYAHKKKRNALQIFFTIIYYAVREMDRVKNIIRQHITEQIEMENEESLKLIQETLKYLLSFIDQLNLTQAINHSLLEKTLNHLRSMVDKIDERITSLSSILSQLDKKERFYLKEYEENRSQFLSKWHATFNDKNSDIKFETYKIKITFPEKYRNLPGLEGFDGYIEIDRAAYIAYAKAKGEIYKKGGMSLERIIEHSQDAMMIIENKVMEALSFITDESQRKDVVREIMNQKEVSFCVNNLDAHINNDVASKTFLYEHYNKAKELDGELENIRAHKQYVVNEIDTLQKKREMYVEAINQLSNISKTPSQDKISESKPVGIELIDKLLNDLDKNIDNNSQMLTSKLQASRDVIQHTNNYVDEVSGTVTHCCKTIGDIATGKCSDNELDDLLSDNSMLLNIEAKGAELINEVNEIMKYPDLCNDDVRNFSPMM